MKTPITFFLIYLFIFCCSCNDDHNNLQSEKNYIEISFNGENVKVYKTQGSSYAREDEINNEKPSIFDVIAYINTSNYTFQLALYHYISFKDFESSQTGTYNICDTCSIPSNMDAFVYLEDKTDSDIRTSLLPGAKHKVNELTNLGDEIPSTYVNGSVKYRIKGELNNMIFRNKSNENIVVTVKYEAFISLVK